MIPHIWLTDWRSCSFTKAKMSEVLSTILFKIYDRIWLAHYEKVLCIHRSALYWIIFWIDWRFSWIWGRFHFQFLNVNLKKYFILTFSKFTLSKRSKFRFKLNLPKKFSVSTNELVPALTAFKYYTHVLHALSTADNRLDWLVINH